METFIKKVEDLGELLKRYELKIITGSLYMIGEISQQLLY